METKKTKIICTISDLNCEIDFIRDLYENGMNVVRINSAHATLEGAQKIVDNVRAVSDRIAILIDTKGPEVRLTPMESAVGFAVKEGDVLEIRFGEKMARFRILKVAEVVRKNDAGAMYELLEGEEDL